MDASIDDVLAIEEAAFARICADARRQGRRGRLRGEASSRIFRNLREVSGAPSTPDYWACTLAHTATSGLVAARRGQDTDLSLMRVTALLPGPQYAVTSTSSWLQAAVQAAVSQLVRMTRSDPVAAA